MERNFIFLCVCGLLTVSRPAYPAGGDDYLLRFARNWTGGGTALIVYFLPNWRVNCDLASSSGPHSVRLAGNCRLSLLGFLSDSIDTTLSYNTGTNTYSGIYSVNGETPATMVGTLNGDALNLNVTWPIPINGHLHAVIRMMNDGNGHLSLTSIDPLGRDEHTPLVTSELAFVPK